MRLRGVASLLAAGAACLTLSSPARAQGTGGLSGQVVDAGTQAPVADALVIATSPSLQGEQTAVTDGTGRFEIALLPAGVYALAVHREGYQPYTQDRLTVRLDRTIKVKLLLLPGAMLGETIEINVQRPALDTTHVETGGSISKEQMSLVPYGRTARNFEAVITSVPGAHADLYGTSLNGASSPEHSYIVDGVQVSDPAYGIQGTTLLQDFVQEVDVKSGGYQAEYGRASGGVVNVVTKSGGNDFHGSVFVNWSPFEATRKQVGAVFAIATQARQRYNLDLGAEVGGPILRDRLWFYAGLAPQLQSTVTDRVIQARTDDGTGNPVLDANGNPVFHEVARKGYTNTQAAWQYTGKLTLLLNENHSLALAAYGNPTQISGARVGTGNDGAAFYDASTQSLDFSLRYQGKLLNKAMLVEASVSHHRQIGTQIYDGELTLHDVPGMTAAQRRDTPALTWSTQGFPAGSYFNLLDPRFDDGTVPDYQKSDAVLAACSPGPTGFNPCPVNSYRMGGWGGLGYTTADRTGALLKLSNFVEALGHHQLKYGVDAQLDHYSVDSSYSGGMLWTAYPAADEFVGAAFGTATPSEPNAPLLDGTGRPFAFKHATEHRTVTNQSVAAFAQDTWAILDKVVLEAGVRWEHQRIVGDADDAFDSQGRPFLPPSITLDNLMPRLGLIWDFTGRGLSKVYASFGRFYEYVPLDLADRSLTGEPNVTFATQISGCPNAKDPRTCRVYSEGDPMGYTANGYYFNAGGTAVDPKLEGQYSDEYQAGAQYQVYRDLTVGLEWVHKQVGRVIEDMSADEANTYFLSNPGEPGKLGYSAQTGTGAVLFPPPRRIYDGVTLSLNKSFSERWFGSASYTWSSYRGNYSGLLKQDTGQLDPNITSEYDLASLMANRDGPLPGDVPNSLKAAGGTIIELGANTTLQLGGNFRLDQGGPTNYLGAHPIYGNGEAYVLPRGSGPRLPWTWQLDLRAQAAYQISKAWALRATLDLFNVTNNREITSVSENYTFNFVRPIVNGTPKDLAYLRTTGGQPVVLNPNFGLPTSYQLPLSARVGAALAF